LKAVNEDESEVVKVACIKVLQEYLTAQIIPRDMQIPIAIAISTFIQEQDMHELQDSDDLLITIVETLKATISLDPTICIAPGSGPLDLLFTVARHGAGNFQLTQLVNETFEDIVEPLSGMGGDSYRRLCEKVLPSLTGAFDVASITNNDPLATVSTSNALRCNVLRNS
jgi:hypothetical protein